MAVVVPCVPCFTAGSHHHASSSGRGEIDGTVEAVLLSLIGVCVLLIIAMVLFAIYVFWVER